MTDLKILTLALVASCIFLGLGLDSYEQSQQKSVPNSTFQAVTVDRGCSPLQPEDFPTLSVSDDRRIVFVHVGKTGGFSMNAVLKAGCERFRNSSSKTNCLNKFHTDSSGESKLSNLTKGVLHVNTRREQRKWLNNATTFLVSARNPLTRAISAFDMDHLDNPNSKQDTEYRRDIKTFFYHDCFPTFKDLIGSVNAVSRNDTVNKTSPDCLRWGMKVLEGHGHIVTGSHLFYNYEYYAKHTTGKYPAREVFVVRTEKLWGDLMHLDTLLGGTGRLPNESFSLHTHGSEHAAVKGRIEDLSEDSRLTLCCILQEELKYYEHLLTVAVNLAACDKDQSMQELRRQCHIKAYESDVNVHRDGSGKLSGSDHVNWPEWSEKTCRDMHAYPIDL